MECVARYIFNSLSGSILTFYMSLLILIFIRPLIRNYRTLYYLYLLPFLKVFYDLFFMDHSHWAFLHGKNVLNAIPNSRILSAYLGTKGKPFAGVRLHFLDGDTFSIGDIGAETIGMPLLAAGCSLVVLVTLSSLTCFFLRLCKAMQWQRKLPLEKMGSNIYSTSEPLKSPILIGVWKSRIVIPKNLLKALSDKEVEAIYQHERQHLLWKDNLLSIICDGISALFWFIPFQQIVSKKASFYRELACDSKSETEPLLGALKKTATHAPSVASLAFSSSDRIAWLLCKKTPGKVALTLSCLTILGGGAFIFASHFLPF